MVIAYATELVAGVGVLLSVTVTVNANGVELATVGVPLSVPSGLSVRPGGNVPAVTAQLSGKLPPVALNVKLYGVPCTPAGGVFPGLTTIASILRFTGRVPVSAGIDESATSTVNAYVPAVTGVPVSSPAELSTSPGGNAPVSDQVNGGAPPLATVNL